MPGHTARVPLNGKVPAALRAIWRQQAKRRSHHSHRRRWGRGRTRGTQVTPGKPIVTVNGHV